MRTIIINCWSEQNKNYYGFILMCDYNGVISPKFNSFWEMLSELIKQIES